MGLPMRLRTATKADAALLFRWRNDVATRVASRSTEPVEWGRHLRWLGATLKRKDRWLLIAENDRTPVGTIRIDFHPEYSELSWTVAPDWRGNGYGTAMLAEVLNKLSGMIVAEIKPDNAASIRMAEKCGFKLSGTRDGLAIFSLCGRDKVGPCRGAVRINIHSR